MPKKLTISEIVSTHADEVKALPTHGDLRAWAVAHNLDNAAAFARFKTALLAIGVDYDGLRSAAQVERQADLRKKITHEVTLYSDYKSRTAKYAVTDQNGHALWFGRLFDGPLEQSLGELDAALKAVWLASKIKEAIGAEAIRLNLYVDAEYLTYQDHPKQQGYRITLQSRKLNVDTTVHWVRGTSNPADRFTVESGFKKWSDNNLAALAKVVK